MADELTTTEGLSIIEVTAVKRGEAASTPAAVTALSDVNAMLGLNIQTAARLEANRINYGINYRLTGSLALDWNFNTAARAFRLTDDRDNNYHVYFSDGISEWDSTPATEQFNNCFRYIRLFGNDFCGGKSYINYTNAGSLPIPQNTILQYGSTPASSTGKPNLEARVSGRPQGVAAFSETGANTVAGLGSGYALASGPLNLDLPGVLAAALVGGAASGSAIVGSPSVPFGSVLRPNESSVTGPQDYALVGINLKVIGF